VKTFLKVITWVAIGLISLVTIFFAYTFIMLIFYPAHPSITTQPPDISNQKSVRITYPQNGDTLFSGDDVTITWTSDFPEAATFHVILRKDGTDCPLGLTTNTGTFSCKITDQIIGSQILLELSSMGGDYNYSYSENMVYITIAKK
jgi:hypothetical protein